MAAVTIEKPGTEDVESRGIKSWPVWTKEVSRFDWHYDSTEECYILEGEIEVLAEGKTYSIKPGDFVTFRQGLDCVWDIKKAVRKHYRFS